MIMSDDEIKIQIKQLKKLHSSQKDEEAVSVLNDLLQQLGLMVDGHFFDSDNKIILAVVNQYLKDLYLLAGDIYTNVNDNLNALSAYKLYHYWVQQIYPHKSLENRKSVIVYSYRSYGEYFLEDLINKTITCSSPSVMNDPFDSILTFWSKEKNLVKLTKNRNNSVAYSKSFDYYRIRSFVANQDTYDTDDALLNKTRMWSHYADEHKGLCIKYRLSKQFISSRKPWENLENDNFKYNVLRLCPVTYANEYSLKDLGKVDSTKFICMKHSQWKDENEVRLISYNTNTEEKWYAEPLGDSQIEEIIFGYRCTKEHKSTIYKLVNAFYLNVQFSEMYINETDNLYSIIKREYIPIDK